MEATLTDASAAVNDAPCVRRDCDWPGRWKDLHTYLERPGPMQGDGFESGNNVKAFLHACKILVIGAGGLGCELLKNLALSGFTDIHLIDMDTIDVSNLNRQFLFRRTDIGKSKAIVAAEFIMRRIPGVLVTPYYGKIQDKDETYYSQFSIIICGLDSVEARRWINATIVGMFDQDIPETLKPIIDGGTEGFKGQSRVILPRITACYECSLDMQTKPVTFPMCTIANTPRLPEHCIEWASSVAWPKEFPDKRVDGDDPEHIRWLQTIASERACEFSITGVTYTLTQGVVKNIIPAIASTNAIVAASCANEAFKIATNCATYMNNYMMYTGDQGVYSYTFELQQKEDCPVCGSAELSLAISGDKTLADLIDMLLETQEMQLKSPSLRTATSSLYMQAPKMLREATLPNLQRKLKDLISPGGAYHGH
ncbi:hypothetical protein BSLG_009818 [Batrachochytrium salamandrivorans]|nr:hypothetical protein BSLG_009818 [Batrachochytrium salamandrivorans]